MAKLNLHLTTETGYSAQSTYEAVTPEQWGDVLRVLEGKLSSAVEKPKQETVKWQPIDTAPTDNKRPLYLARFDENGKLMELDYDGIWEYWQESWEMPHINGWCWMSAKGIEEPTHWTYQDEVMPMVTNVVLDANEPSDLDIDPSTNPNDPTYRGVPNDSSTDGT